MIFANYEMKIWLGMVHSYFFDKLFNLKISSETIFPVIARVSRKTFIFWVFTIAINHWKISNWLIFFISKMC